MGLPEKVDDMFGHWRQRPAYMKLVDEYEMSADKYLTGEDVVKSKFPKVNKQELSDLNEMREAMSDYLSYLKNIFHSVANLGIKGTTVNYNFSGIRKTADSFHVDVCSMAMVSSVIGDGVEILEEDSIIEGKKNYSVEETRRLSGNGNSFKLKAGDIFLTKQLGLVDNPVIHASPDSKNNTRCAYLLVGTSI